MRHESIVTIKVRWDDRKYDDPRTWTWNAIEGLTDELEVECVKVVTDAHRKREMVEVEPVDVVRFDVEEFMER